MRRYAISLFILGISIMSFGFWLMVAPSAVAQEETPEASEVTPEPSSSARQPTGDNSFCVLCHSATTPAVYVLADGNSIPVKVDAAQVHDSVHSELGCVDCHGEHTIQAVKAASSKVSSAHIPETCGQCHRSERIAGRYQLSSKVVETYMKSCHGLAQQFGGKHPACSVASRLVSVEGR